MKILLAAVNAKFTHMNPAIYSLKAYAGEAGEYIETAEYTINQYPKDVLNDIFEKQPQVIGFSCYIWNMDFIGRILEDIRKVLPNTLIILGGPEVSYNAKAVMDRYPAVNAVSIGEGEKSWRELAAYFSEAEKTDSFAAAAASIIDDGIYPPEIIQIQGLAVRNSQLSAGAAKCPEAVNMDEIPFLFNDLKPFENRMIYYETSRGCPFRCSYCLSSVDKKLRFRSLEKVYDELQYFLDNEVKIVKFIDRTFNCNHAHAMGIWKYLAEHDNKITRFHFEIEADILTEEEIKFLSSVREGLFQFEVGVQSANERTLKEVNRFASVKKIKEAVMSLKANGNIPVHVDLIAGLPYEDIESFKHSFNEVYSWGADELQLGFLKVLHGTEIECRAREFDLSYETLPPYEVLSTKWLGYADIIRLKGIEEQLERYGNSDGFTYTIKAFERLFDSPYDMYEYIEAFYASHADKFAKQSRMSSYHMLKDMIREKCPEQEAAFDALLLTDLYKKEKLKVRPDYYAAKDAQREYERIFIKTHGISGNVHIEKFDFDVASFMASGTMMEQESILIFHYDTPGAADYIEILTPEGISRFDNHVNYDI